jgi:electron transfer flavoprotein beta subunit
MSYDLIIAGMRAVDDDDFLVGTAVAEILKLPNIGMVIKQELADGKIKCQRTIDGGMAVLEAELPVLFTTQRGLNEPRYASLPGIMKAKKKPIDTLTLADIGLDASACSPPLTRIVALTPPPQRKAGKIIEGETVEAKAQGLVKVLHEEAKVL